ncbi:histidinol-phosphate transaminase [Proteiniphilum sp.]|uniref:histidinol-phosphate transaminase n=1 Tax=Proteiniphilum sp. TaxID=1926877 RepID=UPI002B1EF768|nr:histidinol-phosphate transaminase [Proteiniphilum sp.]MEA4917485.1 histidinol-phosphate transaminase [Proteiniphilum sp.]
MEKFDLEAMVRPNIWALHPYSSARDEFTGDEGIFLDANENPFGENNRYPDPHQRLLKKALSERKQIAVENIFIGNGSDEAIDLIYRIFCEPQKDRVIICPPTYGMYEVSASINNVEVIRVPLIHPFELDIDKILSLQAKCIFVCSPNNPTANSLQNIERLLREFQGIVVIDEAYIDFSAHKSFLEKLSDYPNLIVMQTFSKAWGLAGVRVGVAYAGKAIIALMDRTKPPYNVSTLNQAEALKALSNPLEFERQLDTILKQRSLLKEELNKLPMVKYVYPSDANFLLIEVTDANVIYQYLVDKKVIVRNRSTVVRNCLRITVGTPEENRTLLGTLQKWESG